MIENHCERGLHAVIFDTSHDKISFSAGPHRFGSCSQGSSTLQFGLQPSRFYPTSIVYPDRAATISTDRLSGSDSEAGRWVGFTQASGDHQTPSLFDPLLCRKKNAKKNSFDALLVRCSINSSGNSNLSSPNALIGDPWIPAFAGMTNNNSNLSNAVLLTFRKPMDTPLQRGNSYPLTNETSVVVIFRRARQRKFIGKKPQIAVDATGLESRYVSRY